MKKMNKYYLLVLAGLSLAACTNNQKMDNKPQDNKDTKVESKEEVPAEEAGMKDPTKTGEKLSDSKDSKESEGQSSGSADKESGENKLPSFTSKDQDGKPFTNEDIAKNDATVINLWFTGCSACVEEMDEVNDLADEIKKQDGVDFVSMCTDVNYDESTKEAYERIIKDKKPTYKALAVDYEGDMKGYLENIFVYPTTIVVDKNGKVIGDPIEGTLLPQEQKDKLNENIKKAIESSKAS